MEAGSRVEKSDGLLYSALRHQHHRVQTSKVQDDSSEQRVLPSVETRRQHYTISTTEHQYHHPASNGELHKYLQQHPLKRNEA
jgi:hypothetical protein